MSPVAIDNSGELYGLPDFTYHVLLADTLTTPRNVYGDLLKAIYDLTEFSVIPIRNWIVQGANVALDNIGKDTDLLLFALNNPAGSLAVVQGNLVAQMVSDRNAILAAIDGGSGSPPAGDVAQAVRELVPWIDWHGRAMQAELSDVRVKLGHIGGDTLAVAEEIERAGANLKGELHSDTDKVVAALAALLTAFGQGQLAEKLGQVATTLKDELPELPEALAPLAELIEAKDPQMRRDFQDIAAGRSPLAFLAAPWFLKIFWGALMTMGVTFGPHLVDKLGTVFPSTMALGEGMAGAMADRFARATLTVAGPMKVIFESMAGQVIDRVRGELSALGEVTPENVHLALPRLIGHAGSMGMAAHVCAILAEQLKPFKQMGFNQMAAFIADFAGFQQVADMVSKTEISAALEEPSRRRANKLHRGKVPDLATVKGIFYEGLITKSDLVTYMREEGWPEHWITKALADVHPELTVRELALVSEDAEFDRDWVYKHLTGTGTSPEDSARLAAALERVSVRRYRSDYVNTLSALHKDGLLELGALEDMLRDEGLSATAIRYVGAVTTMRRRRDAAEAVRKAVQDGIQMGQTALDDLPSVMAALGYDAEEQQHELFLARLRLGQKLFREEKDEAKDRAKEERRLAITALMDQHRRGLLTDGQLHVELLAWGVTETMAGVLVAQAASRKFPVVTVERPPTEAELREKAAEALADGILALQRAGAITERDSAALLAGAGIPELMARARARAMADRVRAAEDIAQPPSATERAEDVRRARVDAAIEQFRSGLLTDVALKAALVGAGEAPAAADAIVARELARRQREQAADVREAHARVLADRRRAEEAALLAAFQAGTLDEGGLFASLLAIGKDRETARAIVARQGELRAHAAEREDERDDERLDEQSRRLLEEAILLTYRGGLLTADELTEELLSLGLDRRVVAATVARERARRAAAGP